MQKFKKGASVKNVTAAAMLCALSVLIGIFCKTFLQHPALVYYRITFENLPVIVAGMAFGAPVGAAVGACADIISCLCSPNPAVNPLITVGAAAVGAMAGLAVRVVKRRGALQTALAVALAHTVGQLLIKSAAKILFLGMPWQGIFVGVGVSAAVGVVEFAAINLLRSVRALRRLFGEE